MIGKKTRMGVIGMILAGIFYASTSICPYAPLKEIAIGLWLACTGLALYGAYWRFCAAFYQFSPHKPVPDLNRSKIKKGRVG